MPSQLHIATIVILAGTDGFRIARAGIGETQEEALNDAFHYHAKDVEVISEILVNQVPADRYHSVYDRLQAAFYDMQSAQAALDVIATCPNATVHIYYNTQPIA